jgi:hypothetical protein
MGALIGAYGLQKKYDVVHSLTAKPCIQNYFKAIQDMKMVFLCGIHSSDCNQILKFCMEHNIATYALPRIGDILVRGQTSESVSSVVSAHGFLRPCTGISAV